MSAYGGNGDGFENAEVIEMGKKFGGPAKKHIVRILIVILILVAGYSAYYQIEPEEEGLITRFGQYIKTVPPGPHFKLPFGIDQVIKVPVQRQLKEEFGFRTIKSGIQSEYDKPEENIRESRMLTGDLNVADVEWIVQYKIRDSKRFAFNVRRPNETLRDMAEASMRQVIGDHSVTEVLTIGREAIQIKAKEALQELCNRFQIGIEIRQLVLQDVNPPGPVRESFNEVNQAIQERERMINQAWTKYNSVIPEARGIAEQALQSAEGYATQRVNQAQGDVQRFLALQTEYAKAPRVTRSRLYLETMAEVLPKAKSRVFVDDQVKGLLPLLSLEASGKGGAQ
ncbi:MAG: FtsH protease activity modulator HflK [Deltaproteobacteria bacterium]|nr:FtsH protease activity modulator HflK [Deltaproteobacteria bacterium]